MTLKETISKIIRMPHNFNRVGNVSMYSLLMETGYFEAPASITEESIRIALANAPDCIGEWQLVGEDRRADRGWYFIKDAKGGYTVGYFGAGESEMQPTQFTDPLDACAFFIKREIESIRDPDSHA